VRNSEAQSSNYQNGEDDFTRYGGTVLMAARFGCVKLGARAKQVVVHGFSCFEMVELPPKVSSVGFAWHEAHLPCTLELPKKEVKTT
jgi:hypothetical protein